MSFFFGKIFKPSWQNISRNFSSNKNLARWYFHTEWIMVIKLEGIEVTALLKGIILWFKCQVVILGMFTIAVMNTERCYGSCAGCQYHVLIFPLQNHLYVYYNGPWLHICTLVFCYYLLELYTNICKIT